MDSLVEGISLAACVNNRNRPEMVQYKDTVAILAKEASICPLMYVNVLLL